jgi:NAD(P)-dependent dehydrogenase (short-subunit alcohol dehydrogenase family)
MESILITGASSGLGLATALYLAERGFKVYASIPDDAEREGVQAAAAYRGVALETPRLDVTDAGSIDATIDLIVRESGGLFGLVNNAGLGQRGCFEDVTDEEVRQLFEVNFFGVIAVTRRALPHLRAAGRGRVITISSVGGRIASFGLSGYCATKFALEGFAEALALEVAPFGVRSILVEPGIIKTPHWTVNRGTAAGALRAESPYAAMFRRHESIADRRTNASGILPEHVAKAIHEALTARRPRLRYIVGRPASLAVTLRRHLPETWFENVYFGLLMRQIMRGDTGSHAPVSSGA